MKKGKEIQSLMNPTRDEFINWVNQVYPGKKNLQKRIKLIFGHPSNRLEYNQCPRCGENIDRHRASLLKRKTYFDDKTGEWVDWKTWKSLHQEEISLYTFQSSQPSNFDKPEREKR